LFLSRQNNLQDWHLFVFIFYSEQSMSKNALSSTALIAFAISSMVSVTAFAQDSNKVRLTINDSSSVRLRGNGSGMPGESISYMLSGKMLQVRVADPVLCADFAESPAEPAGNVKFALRDPNDVLQSAGGSFRGIAPISGAESGGIRLRFADAASSDNNKYLLRIATKATLQCYVFPGGDVAGAIQPSVVASPSDTNAPDAPAPDDLFFANGFEDGTLVAGIDLQTTIQAPTFGRAGDDISYVVTVFNNGLVAANNVQVRDFFNSTDAPRLLASTNSPNWTCAAVGAATCGQSTGTGYVYLPSASIGPGASLRFSVSRRLDAAAIVGSTVRIQAAAFSQPGDEDNVRRANNPTSVSIPVITNAPPTLTWVDPPNQTVLEDGQSGQVRFTVNDPDATVGNGALTVTGSSSNTGLIDSSGIVLAGEGSANRTVQLIPKPNAFGSAIITLTVNDSISNNTQPVQFSLTVTAVNDAPTFTAPNNISFAVGASGLRSIANLVPSFNPGTGESGQSLLQVRVRVISGGNIFTTGAAPGDDPKQINIVGNNASVPYVLSGTSGVATVGVIAVDNGGGSCASGSDACDTSSERTFTITVVGPNTPPTISWAATCVNSASGSPVTATMTAPAAGNPAILTIAAFTGTSNRRLTCNIASLTPGNESTQSLSIPVGGVSSTGTEITLDAPEDVLVLTGAGAGNRTLQFNSLIARTTTGTQDFSIVVKDSGGTASGGDDEETFSLRVVKAP
jgi:hypothetical protein